jgi:hypothetical protein
MKTFKIILFFFLFVSQANAQGKEKQWVLGMSFSAVEDDGKANDFFNVSKGWNILPFPTAFTIENYWKESISIELCQSVNSYQIGTLIDGSTINRNRVFLSLDLNAKLHFNALYKKMYWFDPALTAGFGATLRGEKVVPTGNVGFGATFWVGERLGIDIKSVGKFCLAKEGSNYLQHTVGIKFRF